MNKRFFLLLIAAFYLAQFGFFSMTATGKSKFNLPAPTPKTLAEIEKVELDRTEVLIPCPRIQELFDYCGKNETGLVKVSTLVKNPQDAVLLYSYTVSGGRIVGQGKEVVWDLKGVRPGDYTITVGIDEGYGFIAETKSATITIKECSTCPLPPCICPSTMSVTGGETVKAGEIVTFTADISGGTAYEFKYNWTLSQGEIIEGQGTAQIKVKTTKEMSGALRATVKFSAFDLCDMCPREASQSATIIK